MIHLASGSYKNLIATGAVCSVPAVVTGFYVNSTNVGIINFRDTGGTSLGDITPAIGWHFFPASFRVSPLVTLVSGDINITVVFNPTPTS